MVKRPLPPRGLGMSDAVVLGENPYEPFEALRARILAEPIPPPPTFTETIEQVAERVRKQVGKVRVAKTLDRSHPLIARLLEDHGRRRESLGGSSWIFPAHVPDFETPFERRRLQILNAVFLAVQRCGCRPWMRDKDARDVGIQVGERNVGFSLERIVPRRRGDAPAKANGKRLAREKMRLTITTEQGSSASGASWQDTDECRLDTVLHEAIVALIVAGEAQYRAGMHAGREWLIARKAEIEKEDRRRRSEAEQRQRERLAKLERERLERLFRAANDWRRAADLRAFVEPVKLANRDLGTPAALERLERWANDALAAADRLDPLRGGGFRFDGGESTT